MIYTDPDGLNIFGDIWRTMWNGSMWIAKNLLPTLATLGTNQILWGGGWPGIGNSNSGPWNEQLPAGVGSGGVVNTGTVYGSGSTGPFIFSLENGNTVYDLGTRFQSWVFGLTPFPIYSRRTGARIRNARTGGNRSADFLNLTISAGPSWGMSGSLSLDRYCRAYVGFGPQYGKSPTLVSGSLTGNWLNQYRKPTPGELDNYLSQSNVSGAGGYGVGAQQGWWPGSGSATGIGIVSPQAGVGYTYSLPLGRACGGSR
jgi:hypothetical protein